LIVFVQADPSCGLNRVRIGPLVNQLLQLGQAPAAIVLKPVKPEEFNRVQEYRSLSADLMIQQRNEFVVQ
jgi:hypothetical protein